MACGVQQAWRIAKHTAQFRADDLSGDGAEAIGGRWNSKGKAVLYAASSIALATLEAMAQSSARIAIRNAFLIRIDIPATVWRTREVVDASEL